MPPILAQRRQKAAEHVIQRHVVITGHNDLWARQAVEKMACGDKFRTAGALAQVAGYHHHVRLQALDQCAQGRQQGRIDAAEVQVRQMHDGAHVRPPLSKTRLARSPAARQVGGDSATEYSSPSLRHRWPRASAGDGWQSPSRWPSTHRNPWLATT